jgi:hypothetical protein
MGSRDRTGPFQQKVKVVTSWQVFTTHNNLGFVPCVEQPGAEAGGYHPVDQAVVGYLHGLLTVGRGEG